MDDVAGGDLGDGRLPNLVVLTLEPLHVAGLLFLAGALYAVGRAMWKR